MQAICSDASTSSSLALTTPSAVAFTEPDYGPPAKVSFTVQPSSSVAGGVAFASQPVVQILDAAGILVQISTAPVQLNIKDHTGTSGANLRGTILLNAQFGVASFAGLSVDLKGTAYALIASSGTLATSTSSNFDVVLGAPVSLFVSTQPSQFNTMNSPLPIQPVVKLLDAGGNVVTTSSATVTCQVKAGTGTATLQGTTAINAVNGVVQYTNLQLQGAGSSLAFTFTASINGVTISGDSASFAVQYPAGTPTQASFLPWTAPVSGVIANTVISPAFVVAVQDTNSIACTSFTGLITIAISSVAGSTSIGGITLGGTTILQATQGVVSFNDLFITQPGQSYMLTATIPGMGTASFGPVDIGLGSAARLLVQTQPSVYNTIGRILSTQPSVAIVDAVGNVVTTSSLTVTATLKTGLGTGGAKLGGSIAVSAVLGVANFGDLSISLPGTGYVMTFTAAGLSSADATFINCQQPSTTPTSVSFLQQPSGATANSTFTVQPQVVVLDSYGSVVVSSDYAIQVALVPTSGVAGAKLYGTSIVQMIAGIATFTNLKIDLIGKGYQLSATVVGQPNLAAATSASFINTVGAPSKLLFTTSPGQSNVYKQTFSTQPAVAIVDNAGNIVVGTAASPVSLSIKVGTGQYRATLQGTLSASVVSSSGTATFTDISVSGFSSMTNYVLTAQSSVSITNSATNKTSVIYLTGDSNQFSVLTLADFSKNTFTPGQQVVQDNTSTVNGIVQSPSILIPALAIIFVVMTACAYLAYKMGYCGSKSKEQKAAELLIKKQNSSDDPFDHGVASTLGNIQHGPEAVLAMDGINMDDLESVPLSTIAGLEGIGSDLTLADVAELSLDEIESIMDRLQDDGNGDLDTVRATTMDLQDMIDENPVAMDVSEYKGIVENWKIEKAATDQKARDDAAAVVSLIMNGQRSDTSSNKLFVTSTDSLSRSSAETEYASQLASYQLQLAAENKDIDDIEVARANAAVAQTKSAKAAAMAAGANAGAVNLLTSQTSAVKAAALQIEIQPGVESRNIANKAFAVQPVIDVLDGSRRVIEDSDADVRVIAAISSSSTPGAQLRGHVSVKALFGIATFEDLYVDLPGKYQLCFQVEDAPHVQIISDSFTVYK
jgi:hypothetical protein